MLTKLSDFYTTLGLVRVWQHFTFTVAELWDFVRTNMYFFHMSEEKSSKFLDFYCLQNFRSDKCTVPLMSFQSNGVPFDQFSWNFMQMIKVCTKRSFNFDDVHVCRLKVIHLYSIKWTLFQILQLLGGSLVMRSWRSCLFLFRLH